MAPCKAELPEWLLRVIEENGGKRDKVDRNEVISLLTEKVYDLMAFGTTRKFSATVKLDVVVTVKATSGRDAEEKIREGLMTPDFHAEDVDTDSADIADIVDVDEIYES